MKRPIRLFHLVAFDEQVETPDGYGGKTVDWATRSECRADFRYERGREEVSRGGLTGTATFKVIVRRHEAVLDMTPDWRMRDLRKGIQYQIREVDPYTDRQYLWIGVEAGVAI